MDINDLHEKFQEYGKNAKEWLRKCALLLPEIEKYQVWQQKGFRSIYEYAFKLASMSKGQVDDALRILKNIYDKPELLEVAMKKGINSVRAVSGIATKEDAAYWAKHALQMSKHELETFVRDTRIAEEQKANSQNINSDLQKLTPHGQSITPSSNDPHAEQRLETKERFETLSLTLRPEVAAKLKKLNNGNWNELMKKFIKLHEENLQKELQESKPEKVKTTSRHIPNKIKKYILKRSNGKCEFPNCQKRHEHLHHTERFAAKQTHDPDKIVALCKAHHDLAHRGLIEDENTAAPSKWKIRKGADYTTENFYIDSKVQFHRRV